MNIIQRYAIISTIKDGTLVVGYRLQGENGEVCVKDKAEVVKLAINGYIINAIARETNGNYSLFGNGCKLRDIPVIQLKKAETRIQYSVVRLIVNNKRTVGYTLVDTNGKIGNYSLADCLDMARKGLIVGVSIQKYGENDYRLRSRHSNNISKLPKKYLTQRKNDPRAKESEDAQF